MSKTVVAGDDDPLSIVTTERWARRFRRGVRVLLVPAAVWLVWSLAEYFSHGGIRLSPEDPHFFAPLSCAVVVFATLLALELLRPLEQPDGRHIRNRFSLVSAVTSALCLIGIVVAWYTVYEQSGQDETKGTVVEGTAAAEAYLAGHLPQGGRGHVRVPTGVFVQSMEFKGTSNVAVSGYVWQRVPDTLKINPGVVFPEAFNAYVAAGKPVYEQRQSGHTLLGWYFSAEFRQLFDYQSYPLDKQNVWLRMWAKDFNKGVVLTPDYAGYPPWKPRDMEGLDAQMVYDEWNPEFTTFSYANIPYSANFGYEHATGVSDSSTPELYFNIGLKRDPQGPLYGQLIRWLFIAVIVFAALFLITVDEKRRDVVGFTTFEVMSFAVGMLLVIVFDQNAVREATGAEGVVYLEYFSYAFYAMILMVGLNAMLITGRVRARFLVWGGNLLPKLLYWPAYLGLVLIATLLTFF